MGAINCCSTREKFDTYTLPNMALNEKRILHYLFTNLSSEDLKFQGEFLSRIFLKSGTFCKKVTRFLRYLISENMEFELFKSQIHLFLRHPYERTESSYNDYEIIEIFFLVSMLKFGVPNMDQKSPIAYNEAKEFFIDLISLITDGQSQNDQFMHTLIKGFLFPLFSRDTIPMEFMNWATFLTKITGEFKNIPNFIRWVLSFKFLVQENCFLLPVLDKPSSFKEVCSVTGIAFFMMSNIYLLLTNTIKVIYSSKVHGLFFKSLVAKLVEYDGPTYILVRNSKGEIYGGFKPDKWDIKYEKMQGSSDCYIFTFWPKLKNYFQFENHEVDNKSSAYLNHVENSANVGLGFGFDEKNNSFRIWIDSDIKNKSYTTNEDQSFERGFLENNRNEQSQIIEIEVWGLEKTEIINSDEILSIMNRKMMKELNKKMTDFIKNKGSKINENFYEKEIHDSFDFPENEFHEGRNEKTKQKNPKKHQENNFTNPKKPNEKDFPSKFNDGLGRYAPENIVSPNFIPKQSEKLSKSAIYNKNNANLNNPQNLQYNLHDHKSDYGEENEKKSYISVKLEPKHLESNASSPSIEKNARKEPAQIFKSGAGYIDMFKNQNFSNNFNTKLEKKPFEDYSMRKTEMFSTRDKFKKENVTKPLDQTNKRALTPNSRNPNDDYLRKTYTHYGQYQEIYTRQNPSNK